ncbi:translocation/assembly module TamB domain-containing protein [Ostreiculturibacter nitratireducens]|uniref:translocation/assembly module TamB domain-containing protein n=1 Tax=Ostreiculturibacter nitratireducens TaxID=3075226 RepID=UPI0031B5E52A
MRRLLPLVLCLLPVAAPAQDDDRGWLTGYLEDNLSGAGREIRIEGFAGALSSRATFDSLTIADDDGVWITITDGAISWNRSALLSGRVEIAELSAASIDLPRAPAGGDGPSAEASGFALPELPVSVEIGSIRADRITLGEPVLGQTVEASLAGSMKLEGGEGSASLSVKRVDGPMGEVSLTGSYANATRVATLDLLVSEAANGIAATKIGLPGAPALTLAVNGTGPIDDFKADIALSTDREPRLKGTVTLLAEPGPEGTPPRRSFRADLGGDVSSLFLPDYQAFFGPSVRLLAEGARAPSGELSLDRFAIEAEAIKADGSLLLTRDGLPRRAALDVVLGLGDGDVLLPLAGDRTTVRSATLNITYDAAKGDGWTLAGDLRGFRRPDLGIDALRLRGSGRIAQAPRAVIGGTVNFLAGGVSASDPAVAEAIGTTLSGRVIFHQEEGKPLAISAFRAIGQGYAANGGFTVDGLDSGLLIDGRATATISDLSRFSGLAKRPLTGSAGVSVEGSAGLLSGIADISATVEGSDLTVAQRELDALLAGSSRIALSARRDMSGTEIRSLTLSARTLTAELSGVLRTNESDLDAVLDFSDLSVLGNGWRGALAARAELSESGGTRRLSATASGEGLGIGSAQIDRLLAGKSELELAASETGGRVTVERFRLSNPQLAASATGVAEGDARRIDLEARLSDAALIAPGFPGPVTASGRLTEDGTGYGLDLSGSGPGGIAAKVAGRLSSDFGTADLHITGGAESALANAFIAPRSIQGPLSFDLGLSGPLTVSSLSGTVSLSGGRIVAPVLGYALEAVEAGARLGGGRANLTADARVVGGGRVSLNGPVTLTPPYPADLAIVVRGARLRDPQLFETSVDGNLSVSGPLAGGAVVAGRLNLGETEIRVPSTGLGGAAPIPEVTHNGEPAAVRSTRARAGLLGREAESVGRSNPYGLDITLDAPRRIFVRGRGLDAELGGSLQLQGTTANIVPAGDFSLVRGRLDLLGKRFSLDKGLIQLEGDFVPFLSFSASTEVNGVTATIGIEGPATEPEITISSAPELPEEEILALLLFGRDLTTLSPFQAAQLASAVATLAGKGGAGIVGRLRQGFGLDDLDVVTDEQGGTAVRVGKYLTEKLYTDVTVGSEGKSEINLNLDVTPRVTARGTLDSEGDTSVGIFYERDY